MNIERVEGGGLNHVLISRRDLLRGLGPASLGAVAALMVPHAVLASAADANAVTKPAEAAAPQVRIENFAASGVSLGTQVVPKIIKTEAQWRAQLTPLSFEITRRAGTERADFRNHDHPDGLYRCICCDTALYDSRTKFESGTGWPSFYQPISKLNIVESADHSFGMERIAVACRRCDAHLGHVFDDGPKPTGLRYCMNAVAMRVVPRVA